LICLAWASMAFGGVACSGHDSAPGLAVPLPPGDRDAYGPLPESVAGFHVSRGAAAGYVDDAACRQCHESIYESYQQVAMARSLYRPDPKNPVERLGEVFYHERSRRYYQMVERNGRYVLRRYCKDEDGNEFAHYQAQVEWVIGSGNHVRTYVSRSSYGELFELPLSWYAESGWGMSPGYDMPRHNGFGRRVERACLFCHNAYPELPVGGDRSWAPQVFPAELPHGIGCQRCHGPGARHVEAAADEDSSDEKIRSRIVDPGHFSIEDQNQLCLTCHLQPESLIAGLMPLNESRLLYQHRPGKKITDFLTYLDHGTEEERRSRLEVNHHAYRLRQSKCFTASAGKLACVTCHDPHRKVPEPERPGHYREKCFGCHEVTDCRMEGMGSDVDAQRADCVSCHMVKARPHDVVRVTITDHLIRRRPPDHDLTAAISEAMPDSSRLRIVPYFEEQARSDPRFPMREGVGWANSGDKGDTMKQWYEAFERLRPHPAGDYINVGWSLLKFGEPATGAKVLAEGVEKFPDNFMLRWAYAEALLHHHKDSDGALAQLRHAFQLAPDNPDLHRARGDVYTVRQEWQEARAAYEESLRARGTDAGIWTRYAQALVRHGDYPAAERALRELIALDPDEPLGYGTLIWLCDLKGDHGGRLAVLRQGASRLADFALQLIFEYLCGPSPAYRDPARGLRQAQRTVAAYPEDPRAYQYLATAIFVSRARIDAGSAIQAAQVRGGDPACTAALMGLEALHRRHFDEAQRLFREFERLLQAEATSPEPLRQILHDFIRSYPPVSEMRGR